MLPPLNPDEIATILTRGEQARALLANPDFLAIVDDISTYHLSALVACAPGEPERNTRDFHHTMHAALREIASEVRDRIDAADQIISRLDMNKDNLE